MTSTTAHENNNSDPLLPEKVSRFYKRIFGETLFGKKPQNKPETGDDGKKTTTSTNAESSSVSPAPSPSDPANSNRERKYGASEASEKAPVAAEVLKKVKTVDAVTHEGASKVDFLFLYFSASWCPPCRHFTPQLASVYDKVNKRHVLSVLERADFEAAAAFAVATDDVADPLSTGGDAAPAQPATATTLPSAPPLKPKMEVIFVSGDTTYEDAEKYFVEKHGEWLMIPFEEIKVRERLIQRYEVTAYPTLIVLDAKTGKVVTKKAVAEIRNDLEGEQFPWRPDSIVEKLAKEVEIRKKIVVKKDNTKTTAGSVLPFPTLVSSATTTTAPTTTSTTDESKNFKKVDIKKLKHFALYFASQTSAPCRAFTPLLAAVYEDNIRKMFSEDETEIIFVSMDTENETHYETLRSQMPWAAISQNHPIIPYLVKTLGVDSLPKLVTISVSDGGKILNSEGRAAVAEEAESFDPNDPSSSASESDASDIDDEGNTDTTTNDKKNKTTNKNKKKVKCGYPWARTKLPLVAPLVASNEVLTAIKSVPCVVLATNRASNTRVLATEFKAAVALYDRGGTALLASKGLSLTTFNSRSTSSIFAELGFDTVSSSQSGGGAGLSSVSPIYNMPSPDEDPSHALDTYDPERGTGGGMGYNESDKKRVQFFVANENHVGSELLLHRLAMLLHENLPPSGIACVFSFDLRENKSGGMLKTIQTRDIVEYTERFVKECEAAAAASPARNLASLEPAQQGSRRRPNQQQQQGENANNTAPSGGGSNNPSSSQQQQQRLAPESIAQPARPGDF